MKYDLEATLKSPVGLISPPNPTEQTEISLFSSVMLPRMPVALQIFLEVISHVANQLSVSDYEIVSPIRHHPKS